MITAEDDDLKPCPREFGNEARVCRGSVNRGTVEIVRAECRMQSPRNGDYALKGLTRG